MVAARPFLGYGPDNFVVGVPEYRPEDAPPQIRQSIVTSPHSWLAQVASGTGIFGVITFGAVLMLSYMKVLRSPLATSTAVAAVGAAAYLASGTTSVNALETDTLLWVSIGLMRGHGASP